MGKCHSALNSSEERLSDCAGYCYFEFQLRFFKEHYILYDGAVEGIRHAFETGGKKCHFHTTFDNSILLQKGWSGIPVKRIVLSFQITN